MKKGLDTEIFVFILAIIILALIILFYLLLSKGGQSLISNLNNLSKIPG